MRTRNRFASLSLVAGLAFAGAACAVEDEPDTVINETEPTADDGGTGTTDGDGTTTTDDGTTGTDGGDAEAEADVTIEDGGDTETDTES